MISDKEYASWIVELAGRYRSCQIKAAVKVNDEMLHFYWSVGEDIVRRRYENRYGTHFYANLSKDLKHELGLRQGLSPTTLKYTKTSISFIISCLEIVSKMLTISGLSLRSLGHIICVSSIK